MLEPFSGSDDFWAMADAFVAGGTRVDRPRSTRHPSFPDIVYPVDYGFVPGTVGGDGEPVDCWIGSLPGRGVVGAFVTIDPYKRNCEVKFCLGCTDGELREISSFYRHQPQTAEFVKRP